MILVEAAKSSDRIRAVDLLPCQTSISHYLSPEAEKFRDGLKPKLIKRIVTLGGSMTLNFWYEEHTKTDFPSCTSQCINSEWELQKNLIFFAEDETTSQKTSALVRKFHFKQFAAFSVTKDGSKNLIFVTNGAANMIGAFKVSGKQKLQRILCAGHFLNTAMSNLFSLRERSKGSILIRPKLPNC